jgi:Flp pilus assembly protein TadG
VSRLDERGQVTAFVTTFTVALLFVIGLVLDGGKLIAAKQEARAVAGQAARAGAQMIDLDRFRDTNEESLDEPAAQAAAMSFLTDNGYVGEVTVDDRFVSVRVSITESPLILGIGGLADLTVHGSSRARAVQGVSGAFPD